MIEQDTIKLLRECDAGVKMGIASIEEVLGHVDGDVLREQLRVCKEAHEKLKDEIQALLDAYRDGGKEANPIAKGMSWVKTNAVLSANGSDQAIAGLMTDGCNMGVKSLNRYLNEYKKADAASRDMAERLINLEEKLAIGIRQFL